MQIGDNIPSEWFAANSSSQSYHDKIISEKYQTYSKHACYLGYKTLKLFTRKTYILCQNARSNIQQLNLDDGYWLLKIFNFIKHHIRIEVA